MVAGLAPGIARADVGLRGPAYAAGTSGAPTTSKPESKLWFAHGSWWAVMAKPAGTNVDYHIYRLKLRPQRWVDTGVLVDDRASTRQDVLLASNGKVLVASHKYVGSTSNTLPGVNDEMRLYRFSFVAGRYQPDGAFTTIDLEKSETLVIDADSNGVVWATWVQADGSGHHVYVKSTTGDCVGGGLGNCAWGGATVLDDVGGDDISSVVRFGGQRRRDVEQHERWSRGDAVQRSSDGGSSGAIEHVLGAANPKLADDHINLKADSAARVYAVTKTKFGGVGQGGHGAQPPSGERDLEEPHRLAGLARPHPSDRPAGPAAQQDPGIRRVRSTTRPST